MSIKTLKLTKLDQEVLRNLVKLLKGLVYMESGTQDKDLILFIKCVKHFEGLLEEIGIDTCIENEKEMYDKAKEK